MHERLLLGADIETGNDARLGFSTAATFQARLVRASQRTGRPIPVFRRGRGAGRRPVERVQVKRRAGGSFGVNVPREPLERLGVGPGDKLGVRVSRGRVVLVAGDAGAEPERGPRPPRLVKRRRRDNAETAAE